MNSAEVLIKFKGDTKDLDSKTNTIEKKVGSKLGSVATGIGKAFVKGTAVAGTAMAGMVVKGVKEYAKLEQSIGGVETLFKKSAKTVIANAKKAYTTAGVSANQYMEQVTSFSASLLRGLGGDTEKAAKLADQAVIDMADNANKFGSSIESIQNAYQGFAKQNYTMLDNLKLGYGGTKSEMLRLVKESGVLGETGKKLTLQNFDQKVSFDKIVEAIHKVQENMEVTGTTSKEAASTISGSFQSMKASFTNFLSGAGDIDELTDSIITFGDNVMKAVEKLAPKIIDGIVKLINKIIPKLPKLIQKMLPQVINGVVSLAKGIVQALPEFIQVISSMLPQIITDLINGIIDIINALAQQMPVILPILVNAILDGIMALLNNVDKLMDAGINLIMGLIDGIIAALPILIEKLPIIMIKMVSTLMAQLPKLVALGPQIIIKLITGIINAIPQLIANMPKIITGIVTGLKQGFHNIVSSGKDVIKKLWNGITSAFTGLLSKIPGMPKKIVTIFKDGFREMGNIGKNAIKGLWNGMKALKDWVVDKVKGLGKGIISGIKKALGIHSPSTEFAVVGKFSVLGYTEALEKMKRQVQEAVNDTFGLDNNFTNTMSAHYSPTINVNNQMNMTTDPLGQVVGNIKTFANGSRNDYNYGMGA